jgi:hypothetical protein
VDFRQSVFRCSACEQVWRRHHGGADTYYWQVEVPKPELAVELRPGLPSEMRPGP